MKKKLLAVLLVICMVMTFMPTVALAVTIGDKEVNDAATIVSAGEWGTDTDSNKYTVTLDADEDSAAITELAKLNAEDETGPKVYGEDGAEASDVTAKYTAADDAASKPASLVLTFAEEKAPTETTTYYIEVATGEEPDVTKTYVEISVVVKIEITAEGFKIGTLNLTYTGESLATEIEKVITAPEGVTKSDITYTYYNKPADGDDLGSAVEPINAGTYIVKAAVAASDAYDAMDEAVIGDPITIAKADLTLANIEAITLNKAVEGDSKVITAEVTGAVDGDELTYTFEAPENDTNLTITQGTGDKVNTATVTLKDTAAVTANAIDITVTVSGDNYNDATKTAAVTIIDKGTLTAGNFTFTGPAGADGGKVAYSGAAVTGVSVAATDETKADGKTVGAVTVKYYSDDVADYKTGSETAPSAVGTYTVKITVAASDNYAAVTEPLTASTWTFEIVPKELKEADLTIAAIDETYTGEAIEPDPAVSITSGNVSLTKGTDYTLSYENNTAAGEEAVIKITFKGNYSGEVTKNFTIKPKEITIANTWSDTSNLTYNGKGQAPTLTLGNDVKALVDVTYATYASDDTEKATAITTPMDAGSYVTVATVTLKDNNNTTFGADDDNSDGVITVESSAWTISPKNITATVKFNSELGVDNTLGVGDKLTAVVTPNGVVGNESLTYGYAWTVGGSDVDGNATDTYTVADGDTGAIEVTVTLADNAVNKNYTLTGDEVKTSATIGASAIKVTGFDGDVTITKEYDGTTEYDFSNDTLNLKFASVADETEVAGVTSEIQSITFNSANVADANAVTVVVTISGTDNILATGGDTFTYNTEDKVSITQKNISGAAVTLEKNSYGYTGSEIEPAVSSVVVGELNLTSADYDVSYSANTNVGTAATVTVTGKGNYTGTATATFTITKAEPSADKAAVTITGTDSSTVTITTDAASVTYEIAEGGNEFITATAEGKVVTITGIKAGTTKVTIKVPDGTNYSAKNIEVDVTVNAPSPPSTGGGTYVPPTQDKTETTTSPDGTTTTTTTKPDGSKEVAVKAPDGTTADVKVDASGKTQAEVSVSAEAANKGSVTLPIPAVPVASSSAAASTVKVNVPAASQGKAMAVTVPTQTAPTGTVAIIVKADGTEQIVKKSVVTEDGLYVPIDGDAELKIVNNTKSFTDTSGHWASEAISFVSGRELYQGMGDGTFAPGGDMNRAMLVTVLHRLEDMPKGGSVSFDDVASGQYYAEAVAWGAGSGIVQGNGTGFDPNGTVTRQQLATFLYRYAKTVGADTTASGSMSGFNDAGKVQSWASDAMSWAIGAGLINGKGAGVLDPEGNTTRAEVATILMRFCQFMAK